MLVTEVLIEGSEDQAAYRASHDDATMRRRPLDRRPTVGSRRMWAGMSGALVKQTIRMEHIVDEIAEFDPNKADPEIIKRFQKAFDQLNAFASKIKKDYRNYKGDE
jgi:hypothetical protein